MRLEGMAPRARLDQGLNGFCASRGFANDPFITNVTGTTTITITTSTEIVAAKLGYFTFDSSHRWSGANKTASANAQASAGKKGAASR